MFPNRAGFRRRSSGRPSQIDQKRAGREACASQKLAIRRWCSQHRRYHIEWIAETISGTKRPEKRKLGQLLVAVRPGDTIIVTELSRLGRSLMMILDVIQELLEKDVKVIAIKEGYELGDNIQSKGRTLPGSSPRDGASGRWPSSSG